MDIALLEGGFDRFQSPNLLAHLIRHLSGSVWTWGALVLAAVAAFSSAVRRNKLVIFIHRKRRSVIPHPSFRISGGDDDSCSCSSSDDDDEEEEEDEDDEEEEIASSEEEELALCSGGCEDERGQSCRTTEDLPFWPEIGRGGGVVKAWEGMGLRYDRFSGSGSISLLDLNRDEALLSFLAGRGQIPAVNFASTAVVLSADPGESGGAGAVRVWDARGGDQSPVAAAVWRAVPRRRVVGVAGGGGGKVYVTDDTGSVAAVDLRSVRSPSWTTWWDADAVMVGDGDWF